MSTDDKSTAITSITTRPYSAAAGGMGALTSVLSETVRHTGLIQGAKLLTQVNQPDGFDCPGCAWPDPPASERSAFEFCENGAKAVTAEAMRGRANPAFFAKWSVAELISQTDHWLEAQGRLTHPMVLRPGETHYTPLDWDDAFGLIAENLGDLDSPDEAVFYTSGRTSNEAAFLYQLFVRIYGTNNMPDCSNMCHESSGTGLSQTIGIGKGTVSLQDFEEAEAIFVIGQNPGTNHPRMLTALEIAAKKGCTIISVNPLIERGLERFAHPQKPLALLGGSTKLSSHYLQVRINGDVALLKGIMKAVLDLEDAAPGTVLDADFIAEHTTGFDDFRAALQTVEWPEIVEQSGIDRSEIETVAAVYAKSRATIICWAMGLTQHKNAVGNIQEVVNLLLLRGNFGKPGAGACPVRGHSNVQGDRTMGIFERPKAAFLDKLAERFSFSPPRDHGFDVVEAIHAMDDGRASVFFAMGGNFVAATPDTHFTEAALRKCRLTVQVSTKLNRSHLVHGETALILPCLGRTEADIQGGRPQFVTCENSMSIVSRSQGKAIPASRMLRSEPAIVAGMAAAVLGEREGLDWKGWIADYDRIRTLIQDVIPGFDDYNRRVRGDSGFLLPGGPRQRKWNTESGRAAFTVHDIPRIPLAEGQYLMATVRSHDQYNTTIYGLNDRYRGIYGERRVVMMCPEDIASAGLVEGQRVDLTSHFEDGERYAPRFVVVRQSLPRRCVVTYFPEANPLVPARSVAIGSNTPASKSVVISMKPSV
ncbi:MAG: molybdopterin-dependent oxidoreductase alpha subunit [Myxococcota bacterium]|jgi:molybdopterin-dependent oxidoreductase alpha subunit